MAKIHYMFGGQATFTIVFRAGTGGGYALGSVHNILAEVPAENVVAMFDSALE